VVGEERKSASNCREELPQLLFETLVLDVKGQRSPKCTVAIVVATAAADTPRHQIQHAGFAMRQCRGSLKDGPLMCLVE
jgi:hypothetical protein